MLNEDLAKDLTLEEFRRFRDLLHRQSGIYLEESKLDSLRISLVTRATRLGYQTPQTGELDVATRHVIAAFQMRFRPSLFDGTPDAESAAILKALNHR